ncbi:MAG: hypothetical protein K2H82_09700 [Oscillospiraceae bacterium]|nr:hypothetical protein [Oscillospiraceae bacterium]
MQTQQNISYRVALGGIVSAFCLMSMFLTGVFPLLYLVLPMISGILLLIIISEIGMQWAWVTYAAVSLLSLFITYDKEAAMIFILFFGCYPMLKQYFHKIRGKPFRIILKLCYFNLTMISYFYINTYLFGMTELLEEFREYGKYAGMVILMILNPFFLMYDFSLQGLEEIYKAVLKPRITGKK